MGSFHKNKQTNKWYCDDCGEEVPEEVIFAPYNYFEDGANLEHKCRR